MRVTAKLMASGLAQHAGVVCISLSSVLYSVPGAAANDLHAADIVGLRLGLSPDDVQGIASTKLKDAAIEPITRRITLGSFAIDNVLLWMTIKEGKAVAWFRTPNTEFLQVNYSLGGAPKVMYINRFRAFDSSTAPPVQSVIASLTEKYGPANAVEGGGSEPVRLYWSSQAMAAGRFSITSPLHICGSELISDADPFGRMRNGDINFNPHYLDGIWPRCGTVMIARIDALAANRQRAYSIQVAIGDFKQLQASDHAMFDALRRGEADKSDSEVRRGSANKAPL